MLTGDKLETALEISRSCTLVDSSMVEISLVAPDIDSLRQRIDSELKYSTLKDLLKEEEKLALIVDGFTLQLIFSDHSLCHNFFALCKQSKVVVCARLSPKQKSDIVE